MHPDTLSSPAPADSFSRLHRPGLVFALAYFVALASALVLANPFQLDGDEGFNLIKGFLVARDFALYADIWSDQPPFYSLLVGAALHLGDAPPVLTARLLTLALASSLLWSGWLTLRIAAGPVAAGLGVVLLVALPNFVRLSVAALIGLPAIALAMAALALAAVWTINRRPRWLILSGGLFGLSVATKAFTLAWAPGMALLLLASAASRPPLAMLSLARWRPLLLWSAALGATLLLLLGASGALGHLDQLIGGHRAVRDMAELRERTFWRAIAGSPLALALLPLAAWGMIRAWRTRTPLLIAPALAGLFALAALLGHRPIWFHLTLLATVPLALLAASALAPLAERLWQRLPGPPAGRFAALALGLAVLAGWSEYRWAARSAPTAGQARLLQEIGRHAGDARWMFTDRALYAVHAGIPIPPALAVISFKRRASGLTDEAVAAALAPLQPELILLARWRWAALDDELAAHYQLIATEDGARLYRRRDLP